MKRFLGILFAVVAVSMAIVSCRKVVHSETIGLVDEINDSVMITKITALCSASRTASRCTRIL